jgi:hypothetical protein
MIQVDSHWLHKMIQVPCVRMHHLLLSSLPDSVCDGEYMPLFSSFACCCDVLFIAQSELAFTFLPLIGCVHLLVSLLARDCHSILLFHDFWNQLFAHRNVTS